MDKPKHHHLDRGIRNMNSIRVVLLILIAGRQALAYPGKSWDYRGPVALGFSRLEVRIRIEGIHWLKQATRIGAAWPLTG